MTFLIDLHRESRDRDHFQLKKIFFFVLIFKTNGKCQNSEGSLHFHLDFTLRREFFLFFNRAPPILWQDIKVCRFEFKNKIFLCKKWKSSAPDT